MKKILIIILTLFVSLSVLQSIKAEETNTISFEESAYICAPNTHFKTMVTASGAHMTVSSWTSSNETIATIEDNPDEQVRCYNCRMLRINCLQEGAVTMTVTASDGTTGTSTVKVSSATAEKSISFIGKNAVPSVFRSLKDGFGVEYLLFKNIPDSEKENVVFSVENESIVKIANVETNSGGGIRIRLNYLALGSTNINAKLIYEGTTYTASMPITIRESVWTMTLSAEGYSSLPETINVEDQIQLKASVFYGTTAPQDVTNAATWTSSNSAFTVNKGLVKKASPLGGTAIITVSYGTGDDAVSTTIEVEAVGSSIGTIDVPNGGTMYTLTFDSNGGTACSPESIKKLMLTAWGTLCTPEREGYTFAGWYTAKTSGKKVLSTTKAEKDLTVYAQWKKKVSNNPKTGIETPIIGLFGILILSISGYLIVKNKSTTL